ncbi:hypothetical protein EZV62_003038 [Acer yangbiense]|uniref:Uncharacterized protein n=1 Tax=Acer yangbiense TaxID=1000413 RepID=A0A5C7IZ77_9ROSI|nr:hypothetical protein EZV62_003038 [Acer yangbiense]
MCGPLLPHIEINNDKPISTPDYIEWLNSQPRSSVLYVAMGSVFSFSSSQIDEMVAGLLVGGTVHSSIVEDWKVGWSLRNELRGNKLITREVIAKTVHKFMDINGSDRRELNERSKQFQQILKGAAAKGGSSEANLDAFIKDITQCHAH